MCQQLAAGIFQPGIRGRHPAAQVNDGATSSHQSGLISQSAHHVDLQYHCRVPLTCFKA